VTVTDGSETSQGTTWMQPPSPWNDSGTELAPMTAQFASDVQTLLTARAAASSRLAQRVRRRRRGYHRLSRRTATCRSPSAARSGQ